MLCWISKGIINITRDYHSGIIKSQETDHYLIKVMIGGGGEDNIVKLKYSVVEYPDFESDFQILKDCLLNVYRGSNGTTRMFNPPTDLPVETNTESTSRPNRRGTLPSTDELCRDLAEIYQQIALGPTTNINPEYDIVTTSGSLPVPTTNATINVPENHNVVYDQNSEAF